LESRLKTLNIFAIVSRLTHSFRVLIGLLRRTAIGIAFEEHFESHRSQMPGGVGPQKRFNLEPQKLLHARAALFRQIEIADKLARRLAIPELRALLADMAEEARQVFQSSN
jgi:hypothetical protein